MMKKLLVISFGVLMALGMVLAACSEPETTPSEYTYIEYKGIYTLPPPEKVSAYGYGPTGVIRVSWDPVANAKGYLLYRKSETSGGATMVVFKQSFSGAFNSAEDLFFDDEISYSNEFVTGVRYTYKVVAFSAWSSNPNLNDNPSADWVVLQNSSKDSNTVTFLVSGANALLGAGNPLPKPTGLILNKGTITSDTGVRTDIVQATWNALPGVRYVVSYSIAGGGLTENYPMIFQSFVDIDARRMTGACIIPLIFGTTYVEVVAAQKTAPAGNNPYYYFDSEPASATVGFVLTLLPAPATFTADLRTDIDPALNDYVELIWDKVDGVGVSEYKVYRLTSTTPGDFGSPGTYVYSGWEDISAAVNYQELSTDPSKMTATDSNLPNLASSYLHYIVIAVNSNGMSPPKLATPVNVVYTASALNAAPLGWNNAISDWQGIQVSWTPDPRLSYKLWRGPLYYDRNIHNWIEPAGYSEITGITTQGDGNYGLIDTSAEYRRGWQYKLESYRGTEFNAELIGTSYDRVTDTPYNNRIDFTMHIENEPAVLREGTGGDTGNPALYRLGRAYEIGLRLSSALTFQQLQRLLMWGDEEIRLYRIRTTATGITLGNDYDNPYTIPQSSLLNNLRYGVSAAAPYESELIVDVPGPGYWRYLAEIGYMNGSLGNVSVDNPVIVDNGSGDSFIAATSPNLEGVIQRSAPNTGSVRFTANRTAVEAETDYLEGAELIFRYAAGPSSAEAQDNYDTGEVVQRELALNRIGTTNDYEIMLISNSAGSAYYGWVGYYNGAGTVSDLFPEGQWN